MRLKINRVKIDSGE